MKNGLRLSMSKGGRKEVYNFGKDLALYQRAKKTWTKYRAAWRGQKNVSPGAWKSLLKDIAEYQKDVKSPTATDRIKVRWDTAGYMQLKSEVSLSRRVLLVVVCRHQGLDLNVEAGMGDVTLCHRQARYMAKVGDLLVGISPVFRSGPARYQGAQSRWPPVYHDAINAAWPVRDAPW